MIDLRISSRGTMNPSNQNKNAYWKAYLRLIQGCMIVWFTVSLGFGVLLCDLLNKIKIGGFQLGFWFAQQGSIYSFIILITYYVWRSNQIDRQFGLREE
jgi:putative solute:sodium symporter small subunit